MGVRHPQVEELRRLCDKNLDTVFLHELRDGLNCSPIEAKAVAATSTGLMRISSVGISSPFAMRLSR